MRQFTRHHYSRPKSIKKKKDRHSPIIFTVLFRQRLGALPHTGENGQGEVVGVKKKKKGKITLPKISDLKEESTGRRLLYFAISGKISFNTLPQGPTRTEGVGQSGKSNDHPAPPNRRSLLLGRIDQVLSFGALPHTRKRGQNELDLPEHGNLLLGRLRRGGHG